MNWIDFKEHLSDVVQLHQDALHIYAALLVLFASAALIRRSVADLRPWLIVLALLVANELGDLLTPGEPIRQWQVLGGLRDLWNTMLLPTIILVVARRSPWLLCRQCADGSAEAARPQADIP